MQEWYFGWEKVSCLERCPYPYRERFHTLRIMVWHHQLPKTIKQNNTHSLYQSLNTANSSSVQTAMGIRGVSH